VIEADAGAAGEDELAAFRRAGHALVDGVADHLAALPSRPVWQPLPDALRSELLALPLPDRPVALDALVATTMRDVLPHAMATATPASSAGSILRRRAPASSLRSRRPR